MIKRGVVISAMAMVDGLASNHNMIEVLGAWNQGCIELYEELAYYAELADKLFHEAFDQFDDADGAPGVYDYEVSDPFGEWFGAEVLAVGEPDRKTAEAKLRELDSQFWADDMRRGGLD